VGAFNHHSIFEHFNFFVGVSSFISCRAKIKTQGPVSYARLHQENRLIMVDTHHLKKRISGPITFPETFEVALNVPPDTMCFRIKNDNDIKLIKEITL
jgi:hypothetical protein